MYDTLKSDLSDVSKLYVIKEMDKVLSLDLLSDKTNAIDTDLEQYIKDQIEKRNVAKKEKNYALADSIRDELKEKGIIIKDTREGTIYEIM